MTLKFSPAVEADAPELASLHIAAARALVARFGAGPWKSEPTERAVMREILIPSHRSYLLVARRAGKIVGTLHLVTKKPWAIDVNYFTPVTKALYLTAMAVLPEQQGKGIGRRCIEEARWIAKSWPNPVQAIRLDAWNAEAGAGEFYASCGFREVARVAYRGTPLIYFEMII